MEFFKPKYLALLSIIIILLFVIFLWQEDVSFYQKINDQKITNFFVCLFTIIGTVATIVFTFKQYELAKLVNRTSIKPDIYPQHVFFKMVDDDEPLDIIGIQPNLYLTHAHRLSLEHKLIIRNIGNGIAKNVEVEWRYDVSQVEELIKSVYYLTPNDIQKDIPFLNPNSETEIVLPDGYLSCCGPKLFEKFEESYFSNRQPNYLKSLSGISQQKLEEWVNENLPRLRPKLMLQLKYSDVQDFTYIKTFETEVSGICDVVSFSFKNIQ